MKRQILVEQKVHEIKRDPVSISLWSKDHWSTLAYLECCCVDNNGKLDIRHMRCDRDRHPSFVHMMPSLDKKYPTRLKGGVELNDHDDWDCLDDAEKQGLIENIGFTMNPQYKLTALGLDVCGRIRKHKANGGSFSNFEVGSL